MFTRTLHPDIPDREQVREDLLCPPHDFDAAWAQPQNPSSNDDTVPALYCKACGEVRAFRVPE